MYERQLYELFILLMRRQQAVSACDVSLLYEGDSRRFHAGTDW
jgi:hypothetical protein